MTEDYFNKDSLSVVLKSDKVEKMKEWYSAFGWTIEKEYPDKTYQNITHIDFVRPHKIENKDRLQYLQVRFEMTANLISKTLRRVKTETALLAVLMFLLGGAILACGIVLTVLANDGFGIACGIIIIFAGVLFWAISVVLCIKVYRYNLEKYSAIKKVLTDNIYGFVDEALQITGIDYGSKKQQET